MVYASAWDCKASRVSEAVGVQARQVLATTLMCRYQIPVNNRVPFCRAALPHHRLSNVAILEAPQLSLVAPELPELGCSLSIGQLVSQQSSCQILVPLPTGCTVGEHVQGNTCVATPCSSATGWECNLCFNVDVFQHSNSASDAQT